jgi:integrase
LLKEYIQHLAAMGLAPDTVKRYFAPVKALLATAYEEGLLRFNPAGGVRVIVRDNRPEGKRRKDLSANQTRALLSEIPEEYLDLVYLLATTGVRIGEAVEVTWSDLTLDRANGPVLHVRKSKTPSGIRQVSISTEMAPKLIRRRASAEYCGEGDFIFPNKFGRRLDEHNFRRRIFAPAARRAGVEGATPHALRHGIASLMAELKYSPASIAAQLGHADGGVLALRRYVHLEPVTSADFADEAFSE